MASSFGAVMNCSKVACPATGGKGWPLGIAVRAAHPAPPFGSGGAEEEGEGDDGGGAGRPLRHSMELPCARGCTMGRGGGD